MLTRRTFHQLSLATASMPFAAHAASSEASHDICIYGATASGIMAAVTASQRGHRVVIVEPTGHIGGMTGGGLDAIDWGIESSVGGSTRSILKQELNDQGYRDLFQQMLRKHRVKVIHQHRLARVHKRDNVIEAIELDYAPVDPTGCPVAEPTEKSAIIVTARLFIDCTYEGDLMAQAGVSCTWGRESRNTYDESLAGVRPNLWVYDIDAWNTPGDPSSGLLPLIQGVAPQPIGSADKLTMGYCFRYKFTYDENGWPLNTPEDYNPNDYEMFRRGFTQGINFRMNRKMKELGKVEEYRSRPFQMRTGNLSRSLLTTTIFGCNADYPNGDWADRSRIWKFHQTYLCGLLEFLRTDPSVPDEFKPIAQKLRLRRLAFDDTQGWPHQLYVREARRMISDYTITQHDLAGQTSPNDSIGLASYGVDDWPYATYEFEGKVALSGGEFSTLRLGGPHNGVYRIPYRSIRPRQEECSNLLVPVCVSASHIAMTSIRMEPVWMILGESAGVAASLALRDDSPVQAVKVPELQQELLKLNQRLDPVV